MRWFRHPHRVLRSAKWIALELYLLYVNWTYLVTMAESPKDCQCHHEPGCKIHLRFQEVTVIELLWGSFVRATCITFLEIVLDMAAFLLVKKKFLQGYKHDWLQPETQQYNALLFKLLHCHGQLFLMNTQQVLSIRVQKFWNGQWLPLWSWNSSDLKWYYSLSCKYSVYKL